MGPRVAQFQSDLNNGATTAEATLAGRRAVTDFSRGGVATTNLSHIALFLNDHVRGALDLGRALRDDPMSRVRLGALTGIGVGAYEWNKQFGNQINDVPQYVRDGAMVMMLPGSEPGNLRYVALPLRNMATPMIAVNSFLGHLDKTDPRSVQSIAAAMLGSFSPVAGDSASAMLPGVAQTALGEVANKDFFRNSDIVPSSEQGLPPDMQQGPATSGAAKLIASGLSNVPGISPDFGSPRRVDYAIQGTTGSGGKLLTQAADTVAGKPATTPPVVGGLTSGIYKTAGGQLSQDQYDQRDASIAAQQKDVEAAVQAMPEYQAATPDRQRQMMNMADAQLKTSSAGAAGIVPTRDTGLPQKYQGVSDPAMQQQIDGAVTAYRAWKADPRNVARPTADQMRLGSRYDSVSAETSAYRRATAANTKADQQLRAIVTRMAGNITAPVAGAAAG